MSKTPISADSHITEPPNCYIDYIESKYRDVAPHIVDDPKKGEIYVIDGMRDTIPLSLVAAAGKDPSELSTRGARFNDLHRGGWDPAARAADQDRDGVGAEIIYPSVGMVLCNHPDPVYKRACFDAYNRWLQEFCGGLPGRLYGMAQIAMTTPDEAIEDARRAKDMGFKGLMLAGEPHHEDYDHPDYDRFYEAVVEMDMPISFHILTSKRDMIRDYRGPRINAFQTIIRGNQDIIGMFIYSGIFERHPNLKLVCVEADAGWAPHFMYRMDHAYKRHRYWLRCDELERLPSEYFRENVYMTFQDDWTAFKYRDGMNVERLMWGNDFPHSDATWPHSPALLEEHTADMTEWERNRILHDNCAELYGITLQ
ncbi:MAG: amidohydrolase [Gammaproteobacteria bacterium]|nr:amidohydrolase [Gammaproteobacteria bacterium]|tara:strand:- start:2084 stop:3187 length:1104 start_codon:yes stop_codon:yes gene_type:complete